MPNNIELKTIMQTKTITQRITKEWSWIFDERLWTSPEDSSRL